MRSSIVAKIWIALAMVLVVALSLTAFLNFAKFEKSFSNLVQSRFAFVADEAKTAIERSLGFGLSIGEVENVQAIIERMRAQDSSITAIEVFNTQGAIVFTSDRVGVGEGVPAEWVRAATASKAERWTWRDEEGYAVGLPLFNALGFVEGGLVVRYSFDLLDSRVSDTFLGLARISGLMMAIFSVLALAGVALVLRPALGAYRVLERDLPMMVATGAKAAAPDEVEEAAAKLRSADQQLAQAYRDVERLDYSF